jgi:hypothetical protein
VPIRQLLDRQGPPVRQGLIVQFLDPLVLQVLREFRERLVLPDLVVLIQLYLDLPDPPELILQFLDPQDPPVLQELIRLYLVRQDPPEPIQQFQDPPVRQELIQ